MDKKLIFSISISAIIHILVIVLTTIIPFLLGATTLVFSDEEVELTVDLAEDEDDENNEEKNVIIDETTLNIDIVPKQLVKRKFSEELANKIINILKIKEEAKLQKEKELEEKKDKEVLGATEGLNVINTYPLKEHAKVILDNFDFTVTFETVLSLKVNSDGSFRNIMIVKSSGKKIVDKSLENMLIELSEQKITFFSNFKSIEISFVSDGIDLIFTLTAFFQDELNASATNFLLSTILKSAKENNKNNAETMTLLNNLSINQEGNSLALTISADPLFVRDAIKD